MAGINLGFQNLTPEARQQMSACLGTILTELNQVSGVGGGSFGLSASTGRKSAGTRAKSSSTRGGSSEQHAKAGAQSHKNDAPKRRGRRSNAEIAAGSSAQS